MLLEKDGADLFLQSHFRSGFQRQASIINFGQILFKQV